MRAVRLGEVISLEYGKSLPENSRVIGDVPVYGSNGQTGWHNRPLIHGPSLIVGRKGSIGQVQYHPGPAFPIDTTYYVKPRPGVGVDLKFVFYLLKELDLTKLNSSTGVPGLNREHAYKIATKLPPIDEQRRIVILLDRAADIRRRVDAARAQARAILPALFLDMFGDPTTNPKKWRPMTLGDALLSGPQNGLYRPASDYGDGTRILRIDSFDDGSMRDQRSLKRLRIDTATVEKFGLRQDDIVINRVNSPPQLGKSVLVPKLEEPTVFESNMMRLEINSEILTPAVLATMLQLDSVRKALVRNAKHAINQSSINQGDVTGVAVFAPPLPLQNAFTEQAQHIQAIASALDGTTAKTEAMAAALSAECFG